jgi:hypothetical protein
MAEGLIKALNFEIGEDHRQMIILAIAKLSIERPGFLPYLEEIAGLLGDSIDGKPEMFRGLRRMQADKVTIELSRDEMDSLTICLGYALGAAVDHEDRKLGDSFLRIANAVHRNNPNWTPYEVPEVRP